MGGAPADGGGGTWADAGRGESPTILMTPKKANAPAKNQREQPAAMEGWLVM